MNQLNIQSAFGLAIKKARTNAKMSQEKFALMIGMDRTYYASVESGKRNISITNIFKIASGFNITLSELFAIVDSLCSNKQALRRIHRMYNYILRPEDQVFVNGELILNNQQIVAAMHLANEALYSLDQEAKTYDINIYEALGMRNLSGLVGEFFGKSIQRTSNGMLHSNLHQDGYPDLLLINTPERKAYFDTLYSVIKGKKYPKDKALFSPYKYGGIEVKATCGSTPPANRIPKPLIGEQRIDLVNSFDWKAHHRETNNLLGILWDFLDEVPTIVAAFYCNYLTINDWGKIVQPKEGGGRTTSVSIMNHEGISKMCSGWIAVIDDEKYITALARRKWIGYRVK